ncbi:flagellar hook capping FlgD N-terminal domain-containing protein [Sinisalibacter aestuarii]|uniref:Basal-body rod modification protein FlgD n=1 Tax=Sinisalibacter aestuarii TaxID=2949426 RepID=A0ABQ5LPY8_9RHOB|nr:flagellar hook capping FlgD N-terminal domain-containing protein [Sinisalibacter aestuarii]GKY86703.1 basal-body rod modification protein FlgD [Sinisalibacter aestuarii]
MDVTSTQTTTATGGTAKSDAGSTGSAMISSDFETFLKMLTVQMENQDPLNPMESTDFAVQLATFSGVEQQVQTNALLEAMAGQLGAMSMSDLAGWVGMEARAVSAAWFSNTPLTLRAEPASGAERAYLVVRDSAGAIVDRVEVPVSDEPLQWAGVSGGGDPLPAGLYSFNLESYSQGKMIADRQMAVYSEVVEARVENGETILVLQGGAEVAASEVDALRMPELPG